MTTKTITIPSATAIILDNFFGEISQQKLEMIAGVKRGNDGLPRTVHDSHKADKCSEIYAALFVIHRAINVQ